MIVGFHCLSLGARLYYPYEINQHCTFAYIFIILLYRNNNYMLIVHVAMYTEDLDMQFVRIHTSTMNAMLNLMSNDPCCTEKGCPTNFH